MKIKVDKQPTSLSIMEKIKELFTSQDKDAVTVFECLGSFYGTSSTAAAYQNYEGMDEMVVCGLFEDGILVCKDMDLKSGF